MEQIMLTITPISFSGIRTLPQGHIKFASLPKLNQDTFRKSPSFTGRVSFQTWMLQNDLTFKDIQNVITNDENIIGQGNYSTAYQIPNCEDFCLKINTLDKEDLVNADFSKAKLQDTEDKNLKINVGQQVAKISIAREYLPISYEIEILRKQTGESIGVPHPDTLVTGEYTHTARKGLAPYEDYSRKEKYARTIHEVANLPVESYEKLIQDFMDAKEAGYNFDYLNSNNLLVDSQNQKINLVDMGKGENSSLAGLLYALTNIQYYGTFTSEWFNPVEPEQKEQASKDTIEIISKFFKALENKGLRMDKSSAPSEVYLTLFHSHLFQIAQMGLNE